MTLLLENDSPRPSSTGAGRAIALRQTAGALPVVIDFFSATATAPRRCTT